MRHQVLEIWFLAAAGVFMLRPVSVPAQSDPPEITITGERGFPIALANFQGPEGRAVTQIVKDDLLRSGFFRFVTQPQGAFVANGGAAKNQIDGRVLDPQGKVLFQRAYKGAEIPKLAHRYADDIIEAITGKAGIAGSRIVFVSDKTGRKELYLCDYDGSNVRQITRDKSISVSPSLSPDGSKLAYTSYVSGYADIYLIDLATGKRNRIISQPGTNTGAAFSPNGSALALTMSFPGNPELFTTGLDGGRGKQLTRSKAVESSPSWSPDGRKIVYVSDATGRPQLYLVESAGGRPELLKTGYKYCVEPDWSPDGTRIAFNVREGGRNHVAYHDFQNKVTKTLTTGSNAENPIWGPNSRHLIYVQNNSIFLHDVETGSRNAIVSGLGQISEPTWSR